MLDVPLKKSFRYVHEPIGSDEDALPPLGNEPLIAELRSRIAKSRGGTFLITGFRGVGKSTLVLRTLEQISGMSETGEIVLPVSLSVARSTTTERLLFAMVRRIFETLSDSQVLDRLPAETSERLLLAYMRTSLSFKETQSDARERGTAVDIGPGSGKGVKALASVVAPKISVTAKRTRSMATEASFLAYSETDVEYDLMRIVSLVNQDARLLPARRRSLRRLWPWPRPVPTRLRLVVILDEVDKLTVDEDGLQAVERLLSGTKNVLTTAGAHFLIVAGPDLYDRAFQDAVRGSGVYESVFGWQMYVPCTWDAPNRLVADLLERDGADVDEEGLRQLVQYLSFKARGVPRRLLQEFNGFVQWEGDDPYLRVEGEDEKRVAFYARLEDVLQAYFKHGGRQRLFPVPIDEDRWRLGCYFVMDRVLQTDGDPFSAPELLKEDQGHAFDPLLRISRRNVDKLLDHLADQEILEVLRAPGASATFFGNVREAQDKVYRLAEDVRRSLLGIAVHHEAERGALEVSLAPMSGLHSSSVLSTGASLLSRPVRQKRLLNDRYELVSLRAQGGMGAVWNGYDHVLGRQVAIKLLRFFVDEHPELRDRARREIGIAKSLRHPQIVKTYDVAEGPDGSPALVMELLEGPTLQERVDDRGPIPAAETVDIAHRLTGALDYLAARRIVRLDLKPSNIILRDGREPIIVDLGIARSQDERMAITDSSIRVGTPAYMSPELILGEPVDARSDLHALGLVMYFCLAGTRPYQGRDMEALFYAVVRRPLDLTELPISKELRAVLARTLERNPDDRYPDATQLREALEGTPEFRLAGTDTTVRVRLPRPATDDDETVLDAEGLDDSVW